jgi:hypothetical protein
MSSPVVVKNNCSFSQARLIAALISAVTSTPCSFAMQYISLSDLWSEGAFTNSTPNLTMTLDSSGLSIRRAQQPS